MRLYSIASARDGERPNTNNLSLSVKRIVEGRPDGSVFRGVASNWLCDLSPGDTIPIVGPFGATFLTPDDPEAELLMVCTGTGVAPFRGFTHRRRRTMPHARGKLFLFFGEVSTRAALFWPVAKISEIAVGLRACLFAASWNGKKSTCRTACASEPRTSRPCYRKMSPPLHVRVTRIGRRRGACIVRDRPSAWDRLAGYSGADA